MKIACYFTAAATALFMTAAPLAADNSSKIEKKTRSELLKENRRLTAEIDSLRAEVERLTAEDSLAHEIMDILEDNSNNQGNGLRPEDYNAEVTDSLLNLWYLHKSIEDYDPGEYDMDSVRFSSNVPDSVYVRRLKDMNSFITLPYNDIVKNYIILYSEKMSGKIEKVLGLGSYYMPIFDETFNRYDLPEELKAMAIIESMLNPTAVSRAGAKGMWQFMYSTAKLYGLRIDSFVDERMDPVKSADAAARYLKDSYEIFGDWNLAIASYNCGAGNVNKAIRRSGGKRAFWDIYPYLPRETRGYVPAFVGALYTMKYYKEYGIVPEKASLPSITDTLKIHRMLHLKQVSELVGVPLEELRNLNPQYRHDIVPGNEREYILRLPHQYVNAFIDNEDSLYSYKADVYFNPVNIKKIKEGGDGQRIVYRVKKGDVLGKIAMRHRVSVSQIKRWNNLRSNTIRVGQRLIIYRGGVAPSSSSSSSSGSSSSGSSSSVKPSGSNSGSSSASSSAIKNSAKGRYTEYIVKNGDTMYDIAKRYPGVSAQNIMDFNGIGSKIRPGMKLKIPVLK